MSKGGEQFRSVEEVLAAAEHELQVDLKNSDQVNAKAIELAHAGNRSGKQADYDRSNRLNQLLEEYQRMTGQATEQRRKAA